MAHPYRDETALASVAPVDLVPPYSFGRWSCPKCAQWRIFTFNAFHSVGKWQHAAGTLLRECERCGFSWHVRGRDGA